MKARAAVVIAGALVAAWGGRLLWSALASDQAAARSALVWFAGGPALHDLALAPAAGLVAVLVATAVPQPWRARVAAGLVISGVLVLLAVPALLRPAAGPPNPGLADRDYRAGLAAAMAFTWLLVLLAPVLHKRVTKFRDQPR